MSFPQLVSTAVRMELDQARILAMAAMGAPVAIRQAIINNLIREAGEAKFWNTVLAGTEDGMPMPPKHPYQVDDNATANTASRSIGIDGSWKDLVMQYLSSEEQEIPLYEQIAAIAPTRHLQHIIRMMIRHEREEIERMHRIFDDPYPYHGTGPGYDSGYYQPGMGPGYPGHYPPGMGTGYTYSESSPQTPGMGPGPAPHSEKEQ